MEKYFECYKDKKYPVRVVPIDEKFGCGSPVKVADVELWFAIEEDYEKGVKAAHEIDNEIFYYCDSGVVASDPTDEEIREYLLDNAF